MKKLCVLFILIPFFLICSGFSNEPAHQTKNNNFIRWVDFNATSEILVQANKAHKELLEKGITDIGTCELLAYVSLKNGNSFNRKADSRNLSKLVAELKQGKRETLDRYVDNKYYKYYLESYHAILDGIIDARTAKVTGFHPISKGHWYNCYDDFGNSREFGFKRLHLGHDLFGSTGTPIVAVEGGTVNEIGWNRYGGWRIGILSNCEKRYYYYAHLRKDNPYAMDLKVGDTVAAGQLIGWMGRTGYSSTPNANMKDAKPHLHFGLQIVFDDSQIDGSGEIWIDVHALCRFLSGNRSAIPKGQKVSKPKPAQWFHLAE